MSSENSSAPKSCLSSRTRLLSNGLERLLRVKKDGCFQLSLIKVKPFPECPGSCPLLKLEKPLQFKVDLFWKEKDTSQAKKDQYSPATPRRSLPRFIKMKRSSGKKLKTEFLSERKNQKRTPDPHALFSSTPPKPATTRGPSTSHREQPASLQSAALSHLQRPELTSNSGAKRQPTILDHSLKSSWILI